MYKYIFNYFQITVILSNFKSTIYIKKFRQMHICKKTFTRLM